LTSQILLVQITQKKYRQKIRAIREN